jgi:hypothetical protein
MYNIKHYTSAFGKAGMVQLFRKNYQRAAFLMMFLLAGQIAFAQTNDHCSTAEPLVPMANVIQLLGTCRTPQFPHYLHVMVIIAMTFGTHSLLLKMWSR